MAGSPFAAAVCFALLYSILWGWGGEVHRFVCMYECGVDGEVHGFVCMYEGGGGVRRCTGLCVCMSRPEADVSIFLYCSLPHFLRHIFSLNLELRARLAVHQVL